MTLETELCSYWGMSPNESPKFPGAQPFSLERKDFPEMKRKKYLATAKLDGVRHLLFLPSSGEATYLVDRALSFTRYDAVPHANGTVIDGELVRNTQSNTTDFVIHDVIALCGENVTQRSLRHRLSKASVFAHELVGRSLPFPVKVKNFYPLRNVARVFEDLSEYPQDGVIFTPLSDPVGYRGQKSLLKWKPHHTIDFKVNIAPEHVILVVWGHGRENVYDTLSREQFKSFEPLSDGEVFECDAAFCPDTHTWTFTPLARRRDKVHGNNMYTIRKTLLNIKENITQTELVSELGG